MKPAPLKAERGFAIILVLAFLVLLLGVGLAFFSRSGMQRTISRSSAEHLRVELLGQQAINTAIGDLRVEIAAGSTRTNVSGSGTNLLYIPTAPSNAAPAISGFLPGTGLENLVKVSCDANFVGLSGSGVTVSNRATSLSTTNTNVPSSGGRYITAARWNAPLLLDKLSPESTTDLTPVQVFVAPHWIYVARDGSNPTQWNKNMVYTASDPTTVVGRYAYAIYNEGGLLDANVAGYPQGNTNVSGAAAYKSALAYADLTKIGLSSANVDALVRWRNYATLGGGNTPTNYIAYVASNPKGFLAAANTNLSGNMSDQLFGSRQQLIDFFNTQLGGNGSPDVQNSLRYLGTFSRELNQPSYAPPANRPRVTSMDDGGNNAEGLDDKINPSFLSIRVPTTKAGGRNDGADLVQGEPLVKKRFALNRLAWISHLGPFAAQNKTDAAIAPVYATLKQAGLTDDFLNQGTSSNVTKYFGLDWDATNARWTYAGGAPIKKLSEVAAEGREPNFIELLKASINVGSIAKPSIRNPNLGPSDPGWLEPYSWQFRKDYDVDRAIMQIAANIIDQYDADGYPTRILFAGDAGTREIAGVENLPYLYRLRDGVLKLREPNPLPPATAFADDGTGGNISTMKDPGVGLLVLTPEVWNPHSQSSRLGDPRALDFRVVVDSADPDAIGGSLVNYNTIKVGSWKNSAQYSSMNPAYAARTTNFTRWPNGTGLPFTGGMNGYGRRLSESNSAITFSVPNETIFREPTVLFKAAKPTGSKLALDLTTFKKNDPNFAADLLSYLGTSGVKSVDTNPGREPSAPSIAQEYVGIPVGVFPLRFIGPNNYTYTSKWPKTYESSGSTQLLSSPNSYLTYRLQFKDAGGKWRDYDKKYVEMEPGQLRIPYSGISGWPASGGLMTEYGKIPAYVDPRTARFGGTFTAWNTTPSQEGVGWTNSDWIDSKEGTIISDRPDATGGYTLGYGSTTPSWESVKNKGWFNNLQSFRRGMFSQNVVSLDGKPVVDDGKRFSADSAFRPGEGEYYADPDMVVRRAMGGYVPPGSSASAATTVGLPMAKTTLSTTQKDSRPVVLNRPFRSVAELGNVFSGTPWKNLDFFAPESGFAPLLDVFCLSDPQGSPDLVAGKVDLNTRQTPVLHAILAGAYKDEFNSVAPLAGGSGSVAEKVAAALVARTKASTTDKGPMANVAELVGRYSPQGASTPIDGDKNFAGFSKDLSTVFQSGGTSPDPVMNNIQRFRETAVRALASGGQTRVWNLLIDVIAQTGKFPATAQNLSQFAVDGEQRYWVHVAIDRMTGEVLDKQVEVVQE